MAGYDMKKYLICLFALSTCASSYAADIVGVWRSIDDKTGFAKALVEIKQESDNTYSGTIIKIIPRPNYTPKEFCQRCPEPYTNKRILGLTVINGLKQSENRPNVYDSGKILDPLSGNIYSNKAKISADGRRLTMRGYIGVSLLGRSQTWLREE